MKDIKNSKEFQAFRTAYMNAVFIGFGVVMVYVLTKAGVIDWLLSALRAIGR